MIKKDVFLIFIPLLLIKAKIVEPVFVLFSLHYSIEFSKIKFKCIIYSIKIQRERNLLKEINEDCLLKIISNKL